MNPQVTSQDVQHSSQCIENERYVLKTAFDSAQMVLARTELKARQATRGHSHANEEIYNFFDACLLKLDDDYLQVRAGDMVLIPAHVFHQVINPTEEVVCFNCFYAKR